MSLGEQETDAAGAQALPRFLRLLSEALERPAEGGADAAFFRDRIAHALLAEPDVSTQPQSVPVLEACLASLSQDGSADRLTGATRGLLPALHFVQSESYLRNPPSPGFARGYGYAVICGPRQGPPTLLCDEEMALGVLALGPGVHYPAHHHPAAEIYHVISGRAKWWKAGGAWSVKAPGETIHHPSGTAHATWAGDEPLIAVYLWRGDLMTDATFVTS